MREWFHGVLVGLIALLGLAVAAATSGGLLHYLGFAVAILATLLCFRLIARAYDKPGEHSALVPVPESAGGRQWLGGFCVLLGLAGLLVASAGGAGGAMWLGLLVTALAWLYVFRLIASFYE